VTYATFFRVIFVVDALNVSVNNNATSWQDMEEHMRTSPR
jgi:hypothetical protein